MCGPCRRDGARCRRGALAQRTRLSDRPAGGIHFDGNAHVVKNSTIVGNHTCGGGGGIYHHSDGGSLRVENSTISGNTSNEEGGGIFSFAATNLIVNSTITGKKQDQGVGRNDPNGRSDLGSQANGTGANIQLDDASHTLPTRRATSPAPVTAERRDSVARGARGERRRTLTRLPQATSPLIDGMSLASCQADGAAGIARNQRGVTRPQLSGCDIGAVEVEAPPVIQIVPALIG